MHAVICIFDFVIFMLYIIKFTKFKPVIKLKQFERAPAVGCIDVMTVWVVVRRLVGGV